MVFVWVEIHVTLNYILSICEARVSKNFLSQRQQYWIMNCCCHWLDQRARPLTMARVYKTIQMGQANLVLRLLTEVQALVLALGFHY